MRQQTAVTILLVACASPALAEKIIGGGFIVNRVERTVQAELPGTLVELLVEEGQFVKRGDILARMRSDDLDLRLQRTISRVKRARIGLQIAEAHVQAHEQRLTAPAVDPSGTQDRPAETRDEQRLKLVTARLELQLAKSVVESTTATVELLQRQLERLLTRAPLDGKISIVHAEVGSVFSRAGSPLVTIGGRDELVAHVRFPAKAMGLLNEHGPAGPRPLAQLQIEALDKRVEGQVSRIAPIVDSSSQTILVTIVFDNNNLPLLRPGMKVTAELKSAETQGPTRLKNHVER